MIELDLKASDILNERKTYVLALFNVFKARTQTTAAKSAYVYALVKEIRYLRKQYPHVRRKMIIKRAFDNLLEAYKRSAEYNVRLNYRSVAAFVLERRPGIAWAVLQARADHAIVIDEKHNKDEIKLFMEGGWCDHCKCYGEIKHGKYKCCKRRAY